jgi:hypothetical protein
MLVRNVYNIQLKNSIILFSMVVVPAAGDL